MKITDVKTFIVGNPWKNWVFVKLYTDEGITGVGEATGGHHAKPTEAEVHELGRFYMGMDPRHPTRIYERMHKGLFFRSSNAANAVETACWDVLAKSLNVPLWQLFGGKMHDRLRVYANAWYKGPRDPGFFRERAAEVAGMGYTALKFDPFGSAHRTLSAEEQRLSVSLVAAVREGVGDDVDILVEGHDRFGVSTAISIGKRIAEYRPMWFETPVRSTDIPALVAVARAIDVPVAAGEMLEQIGQFAELLEPRVVNIVQAEPLSLGIGTTRQACALAYAYGAVVALHQAQSPLATAICAHLHAALPNFLIQECFDDFLEPWARDCVPGVPVPEDGYIDVPDAPGLGVDLDEAEIAKHPYQPDAFIRLFEDGWESRIR
ncbi:MAG: mandelate racemase/muconate lactonizing enzyme family protein [Armatimonadota bacterium]